MSESSESLPSEARARIKAAVREVVTQVRAADFAARGEEPDLVRSTPEIDRTVEGLLDTVGTLVAEARRPLVELLEALTNERCDVMMTPPDGDHGYEVSLSPETVGAMWYGASETPLEALLLALEDRRADLEPPG